MAKSLLGKLAGIPLHNRILAGLILGAALGAIASVSPSGKETVSWIIHHVTEPVGSFFLRCMLMVVLPLVFSSLIVGIAGIGDMRTLGRVGVRSFVYTLVLSSISVAIGIGLANTIRPGERVSPETAAALQERYSSDAAKRLEDAKKIGSTDSPLMQAVKTIVPTNPVSSLASDPPNMLHLMFFALVLGIAITLLPGPVSKGFVSMMDSLYQISAKLIELIMKFAPIAVACLVFTSVARFGIDLLGALGWFFITVLLGLSLHMFGIYSLSVSLLSRISPLEFFRRIKTIMVTAFSTSSSNATLPTALRLTESNLGVPRNIASFVLTIGATANQNGTALYEGVTVLFLAQLAGIPLELGEQITVAYLAMLGGIGTAGIPSGSIPFIIVVLASVGVNPALIAIILGVDRILDMCRTTLNVAGDITAATYVARAEGHKLLGRKSDTE